MLGLQVWQGPQVLALQLPVVGSHSWHGGQVLALQTPVLGLQVWHRLHLATQVLLRHVWQLVQLL